MPLSGILSTMKMNDELHDPVGKGVVEVAKKTLASAGSVGRVRMKAMDKAHQLTLVGVFYSSPEGVKLLQRVASAKGDLASSLMEAIDSMPAHALNHLHTKAFGTQNKIRRRTIINTTTFVEKRSMAKGFSDADWPSGAHCRLKGLKA